MENDIQQLGHEIYGKKVLALEPFSTERIPKLERHGRPFQLFTLWFGSNLTLADFALGFLPIHLGLPWPWTILAILLGNLLGGLLLGLAAAMGPAAGYPQLVLARRAFGRVGGYLPAALNWISTVGWLTVNTVLGAFGLVVLLPGLPFFVAVLILIAVQFVLAVFGHNLIHAFERWMAVVLGVVFVIASIVVLTGPVPPGSYQPLGAHGFSLFAIVLAASFSYIASWSPYASDYSRYLPEQSPKRTLVLWTWLGGGLASAWLELLGAAVAVAAGSQSADPISAFHGVMGGLGMLAVIALVVGGVAANALNLYSNSLSARALDLAWPRWVLAALAAVVAIGASLYGGGRFENFYEEFLLLLGYWVTPWLAVIIVDFYFGVKGGDMNRAPGTMGWWGLSSYLLGVLASVPFMSNSMFTGPLALRMGGADLSFYVGFVVAGGLYLLWRRAPGTKTIGQVP